MYDNSAAGCFFRERNQTKVGLKLRDVKIKLGISDRKKSDQGGIETCAVCT